jgi:hypothetical protein
MKTITNRNISVSISACLLFFAMALLTWHYVDSAQRITPWPNKEMISDWESRDYSIEDFLLRTETPPFPLSSDQIQEITLLYNSGLEFNNDPNDPCSKLKLLGLKKLNKWINQFTQRGFTVEKIRQTLDVGIRNTYIHPSGSHFTRIIHPDGSSVIFDFVNCIIWQIAPADFKF